MLILAVYVAFGQVPNAPVVQINSGNPRFPFPRFAEYGAGKNLALYNPEGVVHAEMEQDIRDAYQIMMNRARVETITLGGTPYVSFNNFVQHTDLRGGYGTFVTEGDGYALIIAAYMADKKTFDGLWMWCHDFRLTHVKRYIDCTDLRPTYFFGKNAELWNVTSTSASSEDRATDGTVDYAIALLMAYRQWGEHSGIIDACGNEINYKTEALNFINSMVEPFLNTDRSDNLKYYMMGVVGLDGYTKSGNKWIELTDWAQGTLQTTMSGIGVPMTGTGVDPTGLSANVYWINGRTTTRDFFDYHASGYFKEYGDFLQEVYDANDPKYVTTLFNIAQCRRAEASTDWLMQQAIAKGYTPYIGGISACANDGSSVTFQNVGEGEDFRLPMRTIANYIWHGTPNYKWDPIAHKVIAGTQTSELAAANKLCTFLKAPSNNCESLGMDPTGAKIKYTGVTVLRQAYDMTGTSIDSYYTNYTLGSSVTAPVAAGDIDLAAKMYRQLTIEWDVEESLAEVKADPLKRYLMSTPKYFHGYYRNFGMLMLTGNYIAPNAAAPVANLKCYVDINKTYGPVGDIITYTVSYRNYASVSAQNSVLTFTVPNEVAFVSCQGGGTYNATTRKITWNLATVPGFVTGGLAATKGQFTILTKVNATSGRFCPTSNISCSNGTGWTSNEYPNNISATMQRNCYDIVAKALEITKTSNVAELNPAMPVEYTLKFKNNASAGYLDGGRPGTRATFAVGFSGGNTDAGAANSMSLQLFFRLYHAADEAYIDYSNYRLSFFMKSDTRGITPALGSDGWFIKSWIDEGGPLVTKWDEIILPFGHPAQNSVNQRVIIGFPSALAAPAAHLYNQTGNDHRIHKGINFPLKLSASLTDGKSVSQNFSDDWSYNSAIRIDQTDDKNLFYPVTPDFTDPFNFPAGQPVNTWHTEECRTASLVYDKVLIEEFDGYGWRRIFGTSPLPGRPATDVVVLDTIPKEFVFDKFIDTASFGKTQLITSGSLQIVKWSNSSLLPGQELTIKYKVNAKTETALGGCPLTINTKNISWLYSVGEAAQSDTADVKITCETIVNPPIATTMTKTADKASYAVGENIKYTINFEQTVGTTSTPDLNSSTGWTTRFTRPLPTFSSGKITFNNQNYGFITNNYAHGKDGNLDVSFTRTNVSESFSFFFRYDPTSTNVPGVAGFKGIAVSVVPSSDWSGLGLLAYDGATKLTPIYGAEDKLPVSVTTMTMSFLIRNDSLIVWLNKSTNLTPSVIYRVTTLTAGYAGIFGGKVMGSSYVSGTINSWSSHFDSAFNLQITDPLPTEVTFVSADNSGVNSSGIVSWPLQPGPILKGTIYKYGWVATLATCPTTKTIRNTAYVNVLGQPTNTIGAFVTVTCGSTAPLCTAPTSVTLTANPTGAVCSGSTVTLTGAALPTGTSWMYAFKKATTTVGTGTAYNANTTGNYTVIAYDTKDSANCVKVSPVVTVTINPLPTIVATASPTKICVGVLSTISASGGTSYIWDNSLGTVTTKAVSPSVTTTYNVTGTDVNGCKNTASVILTVNSLPTITATATPTIVCPGGTASLVGGGGGTLYSWSNTLGTGTPKTVTPASSTTYIVTGTDANTCSNTANVVVGVSALPTVTLTALPTSICKGTPSTLTAAGATTYTWSNPLPAGTSNIVSPTLTTTYFVTGTLAGCTATATATVSLFASPTISITATPTLVCAGTTTSLKGNGGTSYTWNYSLGSGTTVSATPSANTTYIVTGSDANGCTGTTSTAISYTNPALPTGLADKSITIGAAIPSLTVNVAGIIKWYDAAGTTLLATGTSYTPPSSIVNTAVVGSYPFQITNTVNGCESPQVTETIFVTGCTVTAVTPSMTTQTLCQSAPFTAITASGTNIKWYSSNQTTLLGTGTSYTPTGAGDIYVSQTNVCEGPKTKITVTVNALPTIATSASLTNVCAGNSTTITASGGNTYIWNNSLGTTSIIVTPTATSTYSVTGTDLNTCKGTASISISYTNPALPTASDVSITVNAIVPAMTATGTLITWYNAAGTTILGTGASYTPVVSTTNPGTYPYKITNTVNGCESAQVPVVLNVASCSVSAPTISPTTQSTCQGKPFAAFTATGTAITWYDATGTTVVGTGTLFTPTTPGDYYASQTIGCEGSKTKVTAIQNSLPSVTATATPSNICVGQSSTISVSGGTSYLWSNNSTLAIQSVSPTATTTYTVTVADANTCSNTSTVIVTVTALPTISISPATASICLGSVQILNPSGAISYKWSTGAGSIGLGSITITPTATQSYTVTGTTGGCSSTAVATVTIYPLTTTTITANKNPICIGETVSITALGSGTYKWSTAATTSVITVSPTTSTSYSVTGTDANACITTASTSVTVNPLPTVIASASSTSVCLGNATTLSASGANSYNWSGTLGTGSSVSITPSATNSYFVTGTNSFNCSSTASIIVTTQAMPSVTLTGGGSYCTTMPAVNVLVSGGKANYKVTYTTNGISPFTMPAVTTTSTALPITADGDYAISLVEDANGCNAAAYPAKVSVVQNGLATYTISGGATYCQGQARAAIAINITSLDGPWDLVYNDGTADHTQLSIAASALPFLINNPAKGIYTVKQIINKNSCVALGDASISETVTINDTTITTFTGLPDNLCDNGKPITLAFSPTPATGETAIIGSPSGGVLSSQFFPSQSGGAGIKTLTINYTNAAGCKSVTNTNITVIASPVASIAGAPSYDVCFGLNDTINASHTSTTAPYSNGWYLSNTLLTADNVEDPIFKGGTPVGTYPLQYVVTDGNGCKDSADISIIVKNKTKPKWLTTLPELCTNNSSINLKDYVTPYDLINGSFTIDGNPLASTIIDPKVVSATTHNIVYTYAIGSCSDSEDTVLTIKTAPSISLGSDQTEFCDNASTPTYTFTSLSPSTGGSLSGTGVSAGTLTFDPKLATTKDSPFNLTYSVTQNGCSDSKLVPVTVWSAPVVTFALPTIACAKDLGINLAAISTPALGTYSVAEGVSGSSFYPKTVTTFGSPIAISYSVSSHGCTTTVDKQITVNKTAVPTVTDASAIVPVTVVPPVTASGTALKLYGDIPSYPLIDGNWIGSYANAANTTANVYNYWVTQTVNGCVSDSVPVKLTITNCTALTPTGVSASQCFGDAPGALTATGLSQAGMVYRWFLNNVYTGTEAASLPMATGLAVAKYTYNVKIYDPVNTCYGAASQPVIYEVKALPAISFSPDTVMCENNAIQNLSAKTVPNTATFWLAGSQIPNFNPAGKIGLNTIEVRYTDPTTTCKNNMFTTIRVKALPSLTFTPPTTACSNGAVINFAATPLGGTYFGGPLASDGKSVNPKNLALTAATTYNYRYTDVISGCSDTISAAITAYDSTKVKIQLTPANTNLCVNGSAIALTADVTGGNFSVNGTANAGSFNPTSAGTFTVIYKYTNANGCLSSDKATITVHALPTISNTIPLASLAACSNGGSISLTGAPSGLVFSGTAVSSSLAGYTFNPTTAGAGTFPITYSFTDSYSCTNSASVSIAVQDIQPPVVSDQSFYSFNYPKIITATGANLKWYGKTGKTDFLLAANQLTNTDLKTKNYADSLNIASPTPYVFNVSQTIGACESNLAKINVTINSCTAQTPAISSLTPSSCFGDPFTTITVTSHIRGDVTHWYDANHQLITTGDSFTPTAANLASSNGTSILYVADLLLGEGCKSNFSQIAYTVKFVDKPTVINPSPICETDIAGKKLSATGNGGTFLWTYASQTFTGSDLILTSAGITAGQASAFAVSVVQQKNGCNSAPVSAPVTVSIKPSKPTVPAYFEKCYVTDQFSDIIATAAGTVKWYSDASLSTSSIVATNANLLASSLEKSVGTHYYYAINYENACYSDTATASYLVKPLPSVPVGKDVYKCSTDMAIPSLSVSVQSGASAIWYNDQNLIPANMVFNGVNYLPTQADAYFYVIANLNGCASTVPKKIRVITYTAPMPTVTATQTALCPPQDKTTLKATGLNVKWYDQTKTSINTTIPSQLVYYWSSEGQHTFFATAQSMTPDGLTSCYSDYAQAPVITDKPVPAAIVIVDTLEICMNEAIKTFQTNYSGTGTITWQNDKGVNIATGPIYTPKKTDLISGTINTFTATINENGCFGDATKALMNVHAVVPKPGITQSPKTYCIGSSAPLQITTNVLMPFWLDANNKSTTIDSIIAKAQKVGSFIIKAYQFEGNCPSDDSTFTINAFKTPTPIIEGKDSLCEKTVGVTYNISSANQNATSSYSWAVTGNVTSYSVDNSKQYRRAIDWMVPGKETVSVTEITKDGCTATDTIVVKVAAYPKALFTEDNPGQEGAVLFFNRSSQEPITNGKYSEEVNYKSFWNFGHTFDKLTLIPDSMGTIDNPISQTYEYGYYNVALQINNDFGCTANYEKQIFIDINTGLYVPNSFVPEAKGEGIRIFKPVGFNLETYKLFIYDTWGNLVWFSDKLIDGSPTEGWDGTSNGTVMKMDTYIWRIDATFKNDKQWKGQKRGNAFSKFGSVLLMR